MGLESIVNVVITKGTKTVSQAGFGVPMILGQHTRFAERIRFYTSFAGVQADFQSTDAEYKAANAIFAQAKKPVKIAIGRRTAPTIQTIRWAPTVANNATYTVTINGLLHTYISDANATAQEIIDGLVALINAGAQASFVTASNFGPDTHLQVVTDFIGEPFTFANSGNLTASVFVAHNGVDSDLAAIDLENPTKDWYCLLLTSRIVQDIRVAASTIEAQRRIFLACSEDADVITSATTDIATFLKGKNYMRTAYLWCADQESFPEAAWAGLVLPENPGSETWKFKTLAGITASVLTATQETNASGKNANIYTTVAGIAITSEGKMAGGEFIDITRGIDWLQARIQERVFSRLANSVKIPYTDQGVGIIEAEIRAQLLQAVGVGLLANNPEPTVTVPKVSTVSPVDKAARLLPDVKFDATLAGAIHAVNITGLVSV